MSPPILTAGQKQPILCPMLDRGATVDSTEFVNSSRNIGASLRKSFFQLVDPNLDENYQHAGTRQELLISKWGELGMIRQHIVIPLLQKWQRRSLLNLEEAMDETSHFAKNMEPVITRPLGVNGSVGN